MFSFDTREIESAVRKLTVLHDSIPDIVSGEVIRQIREFAASGKNPDGTNWKPYVKWYLAVRKKKGRPVSPVDKRITGQFLASIKNRNMIIAPDESQMKKALGMESKRTSFQVSPITPGNIERILLKAFNELL